MPRVAWEAGVAKRYRLSWTFSLGLLYNCDSTNGLTFCLTFSWRVTIRHGNSMALPWHFMGSHELSWCFMGMPLGVPWHFHGVPRCFTAWFSVACHEIHYGIAMVRFRWHAMKYTMSLPWYCRMALPRNTPMEIQCATEWPMTMPR